ncbi:MAG: ABC transporter permease [bacterium]|nr:ABC transporter permease [bacterium]
MRFSLLKELAITDFKLRYKNSVLGYLWSLLKPLAIFGSLYLVFSIFVRFDVPNYSLFLLLGILLWNYFTEATLNGMHALETKSTLLTKINVNKFTIVLASNVTTLLTLVLNLAIFFVILAFVKPEIGWTVLALPLVVANLFMISLGLSLALSVWYVRLRDLSSIWEILLQIGFWVTPIIYPLSMVPDRFLGYIGLNPLHRIIHEGRQLLIELIWPRPSSMLITTAIMLLFLALGYVVFKSKEKNIAEEL